MRRAIAEIEKKIEKKAYEHIYFSPHLDDVVFSCGGRIARQRHNGERVLVVTAFSGGAGQSGINDPLFAPFIDMDCRRKEDERAMEALTADHFWLGYDEAFRRDKRYSSLVGMISQVSDSDSRLCENLLEIILKLCENIESAELYFPLGIGGHVDHQILFALGTRIQEHNGLRSGVSFYEDAPYVFIPHLLRRRMRSIDAGIKDDASAPDFSTERSIFKDTVETYKGILDIKIIRENITAFQGPLLFCYVFISTFSQNRFPFRKKSGQTYSLFPEVIDVSEHIQTKLNAAGEYKSQVVTLFGDIGAFRKSMMAYSTLVDKGGDRCIERYWRATS